MCPIVPTFTCGFDRSNFSFAMCSALALDDESVPAVYSPRSACRCPSTLRRDSLRRSARQPKLTLRRLPSEAGADDQDRTGDLVLTKDALCQLSYIGLRARCRIALRPTSRPASLTQLNRPFEHGLPAVARRTAAARERRLERETGIEPATNSLEGCDSTTELLPPTRSPAAPRAPAPLPAGQRPPLIGDRRPAYRDSNRSPHHAPPIAPSASTPQRSASAACRQTASARRVQPSHARDA